MTETASGPFRGVRPDGLAEAIGVAMKRPVLYPWLSLAFVFVSALDLLLTWVILHNGGVEVNWVANAVIQQAGRWGLAVFKFLLVAFIVVMCDFVGRRRWETGRRLTQAGIVVTAIPVIFATLQISVVSTPLP